MATTSSVTRTEPGSGNEFKTFTVSEDAATKHVQGVAITDPDSTGGDSAASVVLQNAEPSGAQALLTQSSPSRPTKDTLADGTSGPPDWIMDTNTYTVTGSSIDCTNFRHGVLYIEVARTGSAQTGQALLTLEFSYDDTTFYRYSRDMFVDLRYAETQISAGSQIRECFDVPLLGKHVRLTGEIKNGAAFDGSNSFTVKAYLEPIN
jgi:hypothetical protein